MFSFKMGNFTSGYINLLKTAIGSGILAYPFLFKTYGMLITILLSIISGMLAFTGLYLYIISSYKLGHSTTLSSLAGSALPSSRLIADLAICFKCFGVSISYLIIIRQLLPLVLTHIFGNHFFTHPSISLLFFLILTSPFSYFNKIDKLKFTSFCGIFCIFIVICTTFIRFAKTTTIEKQDIHYIAPMSILWITGIGKFVFAFTCHQNIFTVQNEMTDSNPKKMRLLAFSIVLTALIIYIFFGLLNYLIYGNLIGDNILETYPENSLTVFIQALYVLVMGFSYPLQINPCRLYLMEIMGVNGSKNKGTSILRVFITTLLLILTYSIAASGINLGMTYSVIGATASSLVCLIFPALFYMMLDFEKKLKYKILSYICLILGLLIFLSAIANVFSINRIK